MREGGGKRFIVVCVCVCVCVCVYECVQVMSKEIKKEGDRGNRLKTR